MAALTVLAVVMCFPTRAVALHSALEWYEPFPEDSNSNKLEDAIDQLDADTLIDVIISFLHDCVPESLVTALNSIAEVGVRYRSTVLAVVEVRQIRVSDLQTIVAAWPDVGRIDINHQNEFHMQTCGQALKAHASPGIYSPNTAEDALFDGAGVTICIMDSGVDDAHPDLPAAIGGIHIDATGTLVVGKAADVVGHGTGTAGCALGRGAGGTLNRGVAPAADLFDARVCDPSGYIYDSYVIQLCDWLFLNADAWGIDVVNMSFGYRCESAGDAVTVAINVLAQNVVVCVSAGNNNSCTLGCPVGINNGIGHVAVTPRAITVAAAAHNGTVDRHLPTDDTRSNFSRVGPGIGPNSKPDITAYGGQCVVNQPCIQNCTFPPTEVVMSTNRGPMFGYQNFGGTSAASPMVAGAAALIIQQNPGITPEAVKLLLMDTAEDFGPAGWDAEYGAGIMDLGPIFGNPDPVCDMTVTKVEYNPSPITCLQPVQVKVTVKNIGTGPVTNFAVDFQRWYFGPNGAPAVLYQLVPSPVHNTAGPLAVNDTRTFQITWTPGVSDQLPYSQHTCIHGVVHAACDNNPNNNRRWVNATIVGVVNYACKSVSGFGDSFVIGDSLRFPLRLGHNHPAPLNMNLLLVNNDPFNYFAELQLGDSAGANVAAVVDNSECPVTATLYAYPYNAENLNPVALEVYSYDDEYQPLGEMLMTWERGCNCPCHADPQCDGVVNVLDVVRAVNVAFRGEPEIVDFNCPKGRTDIDCSGYTNVLDVVKFVNVAFRNELPETQFCVPCAVATLE